MIITDIHEQRGSRGGAGPCLWLHCGCHLISHDTAGVRAQVGGCYRTPAVMMKELQLWQRAANDEHNNSRLTGGVSAGQHAEYL